MHLQSEQQKPVKDDLPDGMLDYACRTAIRDLVRLYGFEKAREKIAFYLETEAGRRLS